MTIVIQQNVPDMPGGSSSLTPGQVRVEFTMMDVLGHIILWLVVSIITLGIGLFFWPYAAAKFIINSTTLYDRNGAKIGRLNCKLTIGRELGHILLWLILSLITMGIAYPFYLFGIARTALNSTEIV